MCFSSENSKQQKDQWVQFAAFCPSGLYRVQEVTEFIMISFQELRCNVYCFKLSYYIKNKLLSSALFVLTFARLNWFSRFLQPEKNWERLARKISSRNSIPSLETDIIKKIKSMHFINILAPYSIDVERKFHFYFVYLLLINYRTTKWLIIFMYVNSWYK